MNEKKRLEFFMKINEEVNHAINKHGNNQWGRHEFYGILLEEIDELFDVIKSNEPSDRLWSELFQVAAVCLRYYETGERNAKKKE